MPEAVFIFWGVLVLLTLAAACNHGWHHVRGNPSDRLTRSSSRGHEAVVVVAEPPPGGVDSDWASGA